MTIAAPGGRRSASTNRLTDTLAAMAADCNLDLDAPAAQLCPTACIAHHTLLEVDDLGLHSRCDLCGMTVGLTLWQSTLVAEPRPWSRWRRSNTSAGAANDPREPKVEDAPRGAQPG